MADAETLPHFIRDARQDRLTARAILLHKMHGERGIRRAQAPDVQIMDRRDPRQSTQIGFHRVTVDALRRASEREIDQIPQ